MSSIKDFQTFIETTDGNQILDLPLNEIEKDLLLKIVTDDFLFEKMGNKKKVS